MRKIGGLCVRRLLAIILALTPVAAAAPSFSAASARIPLEVVREWGIWRLVRDPEGGEGWVNKNLLSGERTAYVTRAVRTLYERADIASRPVWRVEPGVVARIVLCEEAWCQLRIDGKSGYVLRSHIWGAYPKESID